MPFLEYAFDPAHATGSTPGRPVATKIAPRRRHRCPECAAEFQCDADLGDHLTIKHPIREPHVLAGGARIPKKWVIRKPMDTSTLKIMHAEKIALTVDGVKSPQVSSEEGLRQVLTRTHEQVLKLRLRNRAASRQFDIRVLIPREEEIRHIEKEFVERLAREKVTVSDVRLFSNALSVGPAAHEYASALADYVFGVLAKDGAGLTTLPYSAFPVKLKQSLSVVRAFVEERPLASVVASCIRFNLNDFRGDWTPCNVPMLDRAFLTFRQRALRIAEGGIQSSFGQTDTPKPFCPVDLMTNTILNAVAKRGPALSTLRDMMTRKSTLSDEDRIKVQVLSAGYEGEMKPADISEILEDPIFGGWAKEVFTNA